MITAAAIALIAFREGLEAALIVGIVLGYLSKIGQAGRTRFAWAGVLAALAVSVALAVGIQVVGAELAGRAEQIFEGTTMFLAVGVLTWMIFWMRYQARVIKSSLEREVDAAVNTGQNWGLAALAFVAVFREGVETALFLSAAAFANDGFGTLLGSIVGLAAAALVGYLIYASTVRLNLRLFFGVTSALLLIFAAGLLAHGIHEFQEAALIPTLNEHIWNTNSILDEKSPLGEVLRAVVGYNGKPSLEEVIAYWAYWLVAVFGVRWWVDRRVARLATATP
ncbi:MAG: FTR1 family protein [Chloroflexi bacterium]|nr:FTR1 family protein [Chloroflexota bacterium]